MIHVFNIISMKLTKLEQKDVFTFFTLKENENFEGCIYSIENQIKDRKENLKDDQKNEIENLDLILSDIDDIKRDERKIKESIKSINQRSNIIKSYKRFPSQTFTQV